MLSSFNFIVVNGCTTCALHSKSTFQDAANRAGRYSLNGAMIGAAFGPVMTGVLMRNETRDAIADRCFRLRHNRKPGCYLRLSHIFGSSRFGLLWHALQVRVIVFVWLALRQGRPPPTIVSAAAFLAIALKPLRLVWPLAPSWPVYST